MNSKIQRMQKRLEELHASQARHLKKAQEASAAADQLRRDILAEENNAIATKFREVGMRPEDFDAVIALYLKEQNERQRNKGDDVHGDTETAETSENGIEEAEKEEDSNNDIPQ